MFTILYRYGFFCVIASEFAVILNIAIMLGRPAYVKIPTVIVATSIPEYIHQSVFVKQLYL